MEFKYNVQAATLTFVRPQTYLAALIFVVGNILLPQLCHMIPGGGPTWLPIYFFTLTGAWLCGWRVGLLTAIGSPVINCLLFGMPSAGVLLPILCKSLLLAVAASYASARVQKATLLSVAAVIAFYQVLGTAVEWLLCGDFFIACQDMRMGLPGMAVQLLGGFALIKYLAGK